MSSCTSFCCCLSVLYTLRTLVPIGGEEKVITDRGLCKAPARARPLNQHLVICPPPHTHTHTRTNIHNVSCSQRQCAVLLSVPVVNRISDVGAVQRCSERLVFFIHHRHLFTSFSGWSLSSASVFLAWSLTHSFQPLFKHRSLRFSFHFFPPHSLYNWEFGGPLSWTNNIRSLSKKSVAPQTRSLTVWSIACFCRHWMVRHKNAQHTETMLTELIKAGLWPSYDEAVKAITLELHYKAHDSNTREPLCSYCLISTNLNEVKPNNASLFWWGRIYYRTERPSSSRPPCDILCIYLLLILDLINAL